MGSRRKSREFALQTLYLADITKMSLEKAFRCLTYESAMETDVRAFAQALVDGVQANKDKIDVAIRKYSQNWDLDRMAALDRNILRLGAFEILFLEDTPVSVAIDEAVEIAKSFSTEDSGKFINGILDKVKNERPGSDHGKKKKER